MTKAKLIKLIIASVLAIAALFVPYEALGFVGDTALNPLEIRVIAIFVMAALFWILQPFPIWSTSMFVIVLMILTLSNSALIPFRVEGVDPLKFKDIMATFANPIIMLFLGGFFLASAACKYNMDKNLARVLLKPFGKDPKWVLLGLMIITAVFSMFMSNTATAAMMLAILGPVLKLFDANDRGKAAFALAIPLGANIGGMGTPIGTPPNAIALGALQSSGFNISFGQWMEFGVPYVIIMMVLAWLLLLKLYPIKMKEMNLDIEGAEGFDKSPRAIIVYITFAVCVILWVTGSKVHGLNDNVIAMIPMAVFALTGVITKKDLNEMSWDVLWLVAGGFALGLGLQQTGLAKDLINAIPFNTWSPVVLMVGCGFICLFMANFMSHTSTASLLVPIFIVVAVSCKDNLAPLGGVTSLMVAVAFASSLGMCLPISTPPNALAHATGYTDTRGMAITGIVMGIGGLVLSWVMMFGLSKVNFFEAPAEAAAAPAAVTAPAPAAPVYAKPAEVAAPTETIAEPAAAAEAAAPVADSAAVAIPADSAAKVVVTDSTAK
jgi:sodium-dependent dicarboxylate transporter 2/3/5